MLSVVVSQLTKSPCFVASLLPCLKAAVPLLKGQMYVRRFCSFKTSRCAVFTRALFIDTPLLLTFPRFGFDIAFAGNGRDNGRV